MGTNKNEASESSGNNFKWVSRILAGVLSFLSLATVFWEIYIGGSISFIISGSCFGLFFGKYAVSGQVFGLKILEALFQPNQSK